ncbi:hypothetical protein BJY52DRAFT_1225155 [Lactarius psammicola]|nr:hypothetical protein BJY52DRAFT_1225155 [Lactarius psammicola]
MEDVQRELQQQEQYELNMPEGLLNESKAVVDRKRRLRMVQAPNKSEWRLRRDHARRVVFHFLFNCFALTPLSGNKGRKRRRMGEGDKTGLETIAVLTARPSETMSSEVRFRVPSFGPDSYRVRVRDGEKGVIEGNGGHERSSPVYSTQTVRFYIKETSLYQGKRVSSGVGQGMNEARECAACPSLNALRAICEAVGVGSLRRGECDVARNKRGVEESESSSLGGGHTQTEARRMVKRKRNWVMASGRPEQRRAGTDGKRCERRDQVRRVSELGRAKR